MSGGWRDIPHDEVLAACREAGRAILSVRDSPRGIEACRKADGTPVSEADRTASDILVGRLGVIEPGVPVISEEDPSQPGQASRFWLVDPLDGTREYLRGGTVFTVNVALIEYGRPVYGLIHVPVSGDSYWGRPGDRAWCNGEELRPRESQQEAAVRLVVSPGEIDRMRARADRLCASAKLSCRVEALPGALKFCRLAQGRADAYARQSPSCGWDSAAGQAIVEAAGGVVLQANGGPLCYAPEAGWFNPPFLALSGTGRRWVPELTGLLRDQC